MPATPPLTFGVIGIDHPHVLDQVGRLLDLGCECAGWHTEGEPYPLEGFRKQFPHLRESQTVDGCSRTARSPSS